MFILSLTLPILTPLSFFSFRPRSNRTLRSLSYPLHDIMVAAKAGTEKVDALWKQIQEALQRNMSLPGRPSGPPLPTGAPPSVRLLQQGESPAHGSQHQLLDRLSLQVSEVIRTLQRQGSDAKSNEIETARNLLSDAHAAKQVRSPSTSPFT